MQFRQISERIAQKLSVIRFDRKEALKSVAKSVGVSHSVISQIEAAGYEGLGLRLLSKIADYYEVTLDEILAPPETNTKDHLYDLIDNLSLEIKLLKERLRDFEEGPDQ